VKDIEQGMALRGLDGIIFVEKSRWSVFYLTFWARSVFFSSLVARLKPLNQTIPRTIPSHLLLFDVD